MGENLCKIYRWLAVTLSTLLICSCSAAHFITVESDFITISYKIPEAEKVLFASSIDHFTLHPATKTDRDLWQITIARKERFSYFYIIDGSLEIPDCELKVIDDFGAKNCIFSPGM